MTDIRKTHELAASVLQRPALTTVPSSAVSTAAVKNISTTISTSTSTAVAISTIKSSNAETDLVTRTVRKQANPIKQTNVIITPSVGTSIGSGDPPKPQTKHFLSPPPLIPAKPDKQETGGSNAVEHSYAASPPMVANGTQSVSTKPAANAASSDSSSDDSSSDSSASSGEESDKETKTPQKEKTGGATVVIDAETPGPSGISRRGRGRPRLNTSTPKPTKQVSAAAKERKARTTPRKKSTRVPKPATVYSPDIAEGKAALPRRRGRGCGGCPGCTRDDCGKCNYCKDKTKFGGPGRKKQRCSLRICSNFVKALHGKGHISSPGDIPPSEFAVIPVSKHASSSKVAEVIEQLRQNLTSSIPPVIDKDSLPGVPIITTMSAATPKTTSFIIAKPQQLKTTTPAAVTTAIASETKIVGPVIPPTVTTPTKEEEVPPTNQQPTPPVATTTQTESKSEIALRTRRKQQQLNQQQSQVKDPKTTSSPVQAAMSGTTTGEEKSKCIVCGRERKISLMRSNQFCTQRCINVWTEKKAAGPLATSTATRRVVMETPMEVDKQQPTSSQQKKLPRALKNLQIDMTWDRNVSPGQLRPTPSLTPTVTATPKPTTSSTPTPTATTAANKRPTASTGVQSTATTKKTATKDNEVIVGTKRPSQQQPLLAQKKMKEAPAATDSSKSVSFNFSTIPTSTVDPIAAPPLSRTVPPPTISIVPLDQLTALGTALFTQQQQKTRKDEISYSSSSKSTFKIPTGLPIDVRSWTIQQVVKFFESTSDCKDYAALFREQEVDGTALLLLTHESLVKCLGIKLGRALKIMVHVEELQKLYA